METVVLSDGSDDGLRLRIRKPPIPRVPPRSTLKFVVELPPRSKYVPGTGPDLQPLRILPSATSTGYIIERILLPSSGLAADGRPLPKRMTYIVGWRDLPAASLLVPAMQILHYVSPRALEEWEAELEAEMDEDRQNLGASTQPSRWVRDEKTKRRPPAHTEIEQPAAIEPEPEPDIAIRTKGQGMSLSTPQKRKLADFEGLSDEDASPSEQIARELLATNDSDNSTDVWSHDENHADTASMDTADETNNTKLNTYNRTGIITPVPLPSYMTNKTVSIGPQSRKTATVVSLGMDSTAHYDSRDELVRSIEGGTFASGSRHGAGTSQVSTASSPHTRGSTRELRKSAPRSKTPTTALHRQRRSKSPVKKRKTEQSTAAPETDANMADAPAWEVERLEDMALFDVEGQGLVRYFLVRWVGDWPPEQNPSWEPEDNIPVEMVRNYMRNNKKRRAKLAAQSRRQSSSQSAWASEGIYGSVSEAFAGHAPERSTLASKHVPNRHSEDNSLDNKVFIVDDGMQSKVRRMNETPVPLPPSAYGVY